MKQASFLVATEPKKDYIYVIEISDYGITSLLLLAVAGSVETV